MIRLARTLWIGLFTLFSHSAVYAQEAMLDRFDNNPETRWDFIADTVMGGVSTGRVSFVTENGRALARLTGRVSTENRGGFIQFRKQLLERPDATVSGVRLVVRGNGEEYFVHLRTSGTLLPWQYYQAGFGTSSDWTEIRIPFSRFKASGRMLRSKVRAGSVKSVAIVAYGRDHQAEIDVLEVGFYP